MTDQRIGTRGPRPASRAGGGRCWRVLALGDVALAVALAALPAGAGGSDRAWPALQEALAGWPALRVEGRPLEVPRLRAFYLPRHFAPAWDPAPAAAARAEALVRALEGAADHGLDPAAYHVDAIRRLPPARTLDRELLLSDALLRYAEDVSRGRVRATEVDDDWALEAPSLDIPGEAGRAVDADSFGAWLAALPPPHAGYARLADSLVRYRRLAAGPAPRLLGPGPVLKPGARGGRVVALRRRLATEEDRLSVLAAGRDAYDPELGAAVRRFQARHGLTADGIVGPRTRQALDVPAATRARQIVLNLERWRWLPRDLEPRRIEVNAAAAELALLEGPRTTLTSRVIVGEPARPTPVLRAELRGVVVNPPWSIPESIVRQEILPALRRNPRYLVDREIVLLDHLDRDPHGLVRDWSRIGPLGPVPRLQQRPGPRNPLGRIKFDLPNRFDVYLHDTSAPALFASPDRARSHGCVRVEGALDLAAHLLAGEARGGRAALAEALATGSTRHLAVQPPVPVYLLYWTAFVEDGILHLRDDVYGRDRRLAAALDRAHVARDAPAGPVGCPGPR